MITTFFVNKYTNDNSFFHQINHYVHPALRLTSLTFLPALYAIQIASYMICWKLASIDAYISKGAIFLPALRASRALMQFKCTHM